MAPPLPFDADGGMPGICENTVNTTFGFAVVQMGETRAPDDFKYGRVNAFCATRTPIKLPTWDHIGQMCLLIADAGADWSFSNAGQKAAYTNLPLLPSDAQYCFVALRSPPGNNRYGFSPLTLLLGAADAVFRYNFLSRIIAALESLLLELPVANYFEEYGGFHSRNFGWGFLGFPQYAG